jgi:hypothetical protein
VDDSGNVSAPVTRSFFRIVNAALSVGVNGSGVVTPNLNGAVLEVNRSYTLKALPGTYNLFANWSGGASGTNDSLTFVMQTNLVITANFTTNRLVALAGSYSGLFGSTNGTAQESAGFFTLKSLPLGAFSGKIQVGGGAYAMSGAFDVNGHAGVTVPRTGKSSLAVALQLNLAGGSDQVCGKICAAEWSSVLQGDRAVFDISANPARAFAGKYTMLIPGTPGASDSPAGNGYGLISVGANGVVSLAGALGDGTKINQLVTLSKNGDWPLYVPLYSGSFTYTNGVAVLTAKQYYGSFIGWVDFTNNGAPTLGGSVVCIKQPLAGQVYYPNGFTNQTDLLGSAYTPPSSGRVMSLTNAVAWMQDGNLPSPVGSRLTLNANNSIAVATPNVCNLKLLLSPQTGQLKGAFVSPVNGATVNVAGAVLQNGNLASGYFLGTNASGSFILQGN